MTSHPTSENRSHWWLTTPTWRRLHAIPGTALDYPTLRTTIDDGATVVRRAACGQDVELVFPGMGSRLGMPRCVHCCSALSITRGKGTPANNPGL